MTIILVTGANRGIGYAIVQAAADRILDATFILGCRSLEAGHEAAEKLRGLDSKAIFDVVQVDIENDESILAAVKYITEKYGKLDGQLPLCSTISMEADDPRSSYQQRCRGQPAKVSGSARCSSQPQQCLQQRRRITCNSHQGIHAPAAEERFSQGDHEFKRSRKPGENSQQKGENEASTSIAQG